MATRKTSAGSDWVAALSRQATAPTTLPTPVTEEPVKPTTPRKTLRKAVEAASIPEPVQGSRTARKAPVRARKTPGQALETEPVPEPVTPATTPRKTRKPATVATPGPLLLKVRQPPKRAVGYNLPEDVIELIDLAVATAAGKGQRLREGEAVTYAIRKTYNKLKP